jgi:uncharacterized protein (DUF305 family)
MAETNERDETASSPGGDDLVLPWWQHPINIVTIVVTAALLAGMIGWLVGRTGGDEIASNEVDVGFLQDMRVHHEQAVQMSNVFLDLPDVDAGLGAIARSIAFGQSIEIGLMIQLLRDMDAPTEHEDGQAMAWMGMAGPDSAMPGMASDEELEALADSEGAAADELFVELMVAHHQGGVVMMDGALAGADNGDVLAYAAMWKQSQLDEIAEMEAQLPATAGG